MDKGPSRARLLAGVVGGIAVDTAARSVMGGDPGDGAEDASADRRRARKVRTAFERLGPFYVKLGQMLSTRPDLVSDVMIAELEKLHDQVEVTPFGEFASILDQELPSWRKRFQSIDVVHPLGSASLAQVYRVVLDDGSPAVVKIQRRGSGRWSCRT